MKHVTITILLSGIVFLTGCTRTFSDTEKWSITTSFYPLYYFTSQLTGTHAEVITITPSGVEPHDFEPTARDIARIADSKLLILNGRGLEPWGNRVREEVNANGTQVIEVGNSVATTLSSEEGSGLDPHIWLNPVLAEQEVLIISNSLISLDPLHQDEYKQNTLELTQKLTELDSEYRQGLANCSQKSFITSHTAFGYLAKEYGLEQKSIAGLSPDAEPSAKQLADLAQFAYDNKVKYIFFESLVSPKLADTLAQEVNAQTLVLNPLEGLTKDEIDRGEDYFSVMRENLNNLRKALDCK